MPAYLQGVQTSNHAQYSLYSVFNVQGLLLKMNKTKINPSAKSTTNFRSFIKHNL